MPYVNIKITREGATPEQKAELIAGVTELLVKVLNKNPATTVVVIDEVAFEDWGIGGLPVEQYRRKLAEAKASSVPVRRHSRAKRSADPRISCKRCSGQARA
jgi:4-oxalocrotonate tautomerase